ncbi:MAG: EF-hand domain-containing protein [Planctomycetota bacterium]|nr:EF-hand domain-containing protein [Planctomycetota bacterium]
MLVNRRIACLVAVAGLAAPALAQDSVGAGAGLAGNDSLSATTAGAPYQRANYVVDLTPFYTSWGTTFGIAPIMKASGGYKSSTTGAEFFGALISAQGISQTLVSADLSNTNYAAWTAAGEGVNPSKNNAASSSVSGPASALRFGAVFAEFGTDLLGRNGENVIGATVGLDPNAPNRLYVTRTVAAVNRPAASGGENAAFGVGGIDANGIIGFRADGNAVTGSDPIPATSGVNYFRVNLAARNAGIVPSIANSASADAAATARPLTNNATSHNTETVIPSDRLGRASVMGSNFNRNYVYENPTGTIVQTNTHRTGTDDHRGGMSFSGLKFFGTNTIGTGGILTKPSAASAATNGITIFGIASGTGAPSGTATVTMPANTLTDRCDNTTWNLGTGDFRHYSSQVAFRGGNGQVAIGQDPSNGQALVAAVAYSSQLTGNDNPYNAIVAARFNPTTPASATWGTVAWVTSLPPLDGKAIYGDYGADGIAFTSDAGEFDGVVDATDAPIGRLASLFEVTGGTPFGPSISSPAFDAYGNCYFISEVALKKQDQTGAPITDYDTALIRGVYNPATMCWKLDLICELGDTFTGQNSGTKYQIQFLSVADSNSVDSAGFWSNNVVGGTAYANGNKGDLATDSINLGGLVFQAKIVYDVDGDGDYNDPTRTNNTDLTTADQAYNVLLYVGHAIRPNPCPADFNNDGFLDFTDFDAFVEAFEGGNASSDFNGDGFLDFTDFDAFVAAFEAGC